MAEISGIVNYENLYELEILHPVTEKPVGIKMMIRSAESREAKEILRKHADENIARRVKGKMLKGVTLEKQELEKAASYIASWDWGDNTWQGSVPELTMKTAVRILDAEGWIYSQVVEAAGKVENFSTNSGTISEEE